METLTPRPDVASAHAAARNEDIYPNIIAQAQNDFGIEPVPVYIYNISTQEFNFPRPPNHPHWLVRACPKGKPWFLVGSESHPYREEEIDPVNGKKRVNLTDGRREAQTMINPSNPGLDQEFNIENGLLIGQNLNVLGVFWSMHYPPLDPELDACRARLEKTYRKCIEDMAKVESKSPEEARDRATYTDHAAADYFGISTSWHRTDLIPKNENTGKVECPNCGEMIRASAPYHSIGAAVCVLDWRRAVEAGVKTKDEVPDQHRWWNKPGPKPA